MNLYELLEKLKSSGRAVIRAEDVQKIILKDRKIALTYLSRMEKRGMLRKIARGIYTITYDDFVIANQLIEPSYISLTSALYLNEVILQVPAKIECITTRNSRIFKNFIYRKISPKLFFGFKKKRRKGFSILVATPEKAVADGLYLGVFSRNFVEELLEKLDREALAEVAKAFKESGVKRGKKVGKIIGDLVAEQRGD